MSKEQTPISRLIAFQIMQFNIGSEEYDEIGHIIHDLKMYIEQYAKTKVLEALEREFSKLDYVPVMDGEMAGINYYETEVKPNYE